MESNKFKFKYINPSNEEGWSNKYCKIINYKGSISKVAEVEKINNKLNNIERKLNKLISSNKDKKKSTDNNKLENNRALVKLNPKSSLGYYEDYPTKLIKFFFTMQYHISYPPVMNLSEYFSCNRYFKNKLPPYLIYAILSKSSLNSPNPQLYMKNVEFSIYYYNLSLLELNNDASRGIINIYMLHALMILIGVDIMLSRSINISSRLVTCVKLSQMVDLSSHHNISSVQKLLLFLNYFDIDSSQVLSKPKLIKDDSDLNYDDYNFEEEDNFEDLINFNITDNIDLPEDYKLNFKARKNIIHLVYPKIDDLEKNFNLSRADHSLSECTNLLEYITSMYDKLSPSIKYSDDYMNTSLIAKNPLIRLKLSFYQSLLSQSGRIYSLSIKLIPNLDNLKIIELVKKFLKFIELPINLLKAQSLEIVNDPNSKVHLNLSTFFHLSCLLIDLLNALVNLKISNNYSPSLKCLESLVRIEFNNFKGLVGALMNNWEGSNEFLNSMESKLSSVIVDN